MAGVLAVKDSDCVAFLQWALPQLQLRWAGFRKVRKRVCKRLARRLTELGLADLGAYRTRLGGQPDEWRMLDGLCRVVISRFYRDRLVFAALVEQVLPALAAEARASSDDTLRCWSVGSASGEEPYTLAILWQQLLAARWPEVDLAVLGTELDAQLLQRARRACYPASTIRNLPEPMQRAAFRQVSDAYCLHDDYRHAVHFERQDVRDAMPAGPFQLILCRNLVFTYFDEDLQRQLLYRLLARLAPGGWLVLGVREHLPALPPGLVVVSERLGLYCKASAVGQLQGAEHHVDG